VNLLGSVVNILAGLSTLVMAAIGLSFWVRPSEALKETGHQAKALPAVMGGRYLAMGLIGGGAIAYGVPVVIAYVFFVFGLMGAVDALIYARRGVPHIRHTLAGVAGFAVAVLALVAAPASGA
jgi:hypothetical protein